MLRLSKNITMKTFIIICGIIISNVMLQQASAQFIVMTTEADSLVRTGSAHIYNIQFDKAHACFKQVIDKYPTNPAGYFLDAMVEWWRIRTNKKSNTLDEVFLEKIDHCIEKCDNLLQQDENSITGLFFKAGALGFRARLYSERESWFDAASDGKAAMSLLQQCQTLAPSNHDILLGTGLYNYFAPTFAEQYPLIQPILAFLPRGDKKLGILQLNSAAKYARYAGTEAKVILMQIHYQFEKTPQYAYQLAQELNTSYPDNPYFQRYLGRCQIQLGLNAEAEATWRDVVLKCIDKKQGYDQQTAREGLYYVGKALMNRNDFDMALRYFYKCDEAGRFLDEDVSGFTIQVNLQIGKIYDMQSKRNLAIKQYDKVLSWEDKQGSHAEAKRYKEKPFSR